MLAQMLALTFYATRYGELINDWKWCQKFVVFCLPNWCNECLTAIHPRWKKEMKEKIRLILCREHNANVLNQKSLSLLFQPFISTKIKLNYIQISHSSRFRPALNVKREAKKSTRRYPSPVGAQLLLFIFGFTKMTQNDSNMPIISLNLTFNFRFYILHHARCYANFNQN